MQWHVRNGILAAALTLVLIPVGFTAMAAAQKADTVYSGVVTDAMCGAKHDMGGGTPADCVRMCVGGGSDYALVVGQKVYTLATKDKATLATLNKYAAKRVEVRGTLSGGTIAVHSVSLAAR